jgi:hypothetical protein
LTGSDPFVAKSLIIVELSEKIELNRTDLLETNTLSGGERPRGGCPTLKKQKVKRTSKSELSASHY